MGSNYSAEIELDLTNIHAAALCIESDCKERHEVPWRRHLRQQRCLDKSREIMHSVAAIREWMKRDNRTQARHALRIDGKVV